VEVPACEDRVEWFELIAWLTPARSLGWCAGAAAPPL